MNVDFSSLAGCKVRNSQNSRLLIATGALCGLGAGQGPGGGRVEAWGRGGGAFRGDREVLWAPVIARR